MRTVTFYLIAALVLILLAGAMLAAPIPAAAQWILGGVSLLGAGGFIREMFVVNPEEKMFGPHLG